MKNIHLTIEKERHSCGLTQKQVAEKLKTSQNNYCKIENGKSKLTVDRLFELSEIFGIPVIKILDPSGTQMTLKEKEYIKEINLLQEKLEEEKGKSEKYEHDKQLIRERINSWMELFRNTLPLLVNDIDNNLYTVTQLTETGSKKITILDYITLTIEAFVKGMLNEDKKHESFRHFINIVELREIIVDTLRANKINDFACKDFFQNKDSILSDPNRYIDENQFIKAMKFTSFGNMLYEKDKKKGS